jgi:hypothetical protein
MAAGGGFGGDAALEGCGGFVIDDWRFVIVPRIPTITNYKSHIINRKLPFFRYNGLLGIYERNGFLTDGTEAL